MKTIAIANYKGGTGKTATAVNLAALLSREGRRVLLIDADAQHNTTLFYAPDYDGPTLTDILDGSCPADWWENVAETGFRGIDLVAGDLRLLTLDLAAILNGAADHDRNLYDFLKFGQAEGNYDFCLIDCPPSFTAASVAALVCCDEVLLPTRADAFSRLGALELIEQVKSLKRFSVEPRFRVLVTMADRTRLSRQVAEQLRLDGLDVMRTVIHNSVCVPESTYARVPLCEYAPQSRAAQDYEELLAEILEEGRSHE